MERIYPRSFTQGLPALLEPVGPLATADELVEADRVRREFLFKDDPPPYMRDLVRAMRLLRGRARYLEIGTYDKGCLAYVAKLLSPEALLVDVDLEPHASATEKLKRSLVASQRLETVIGDSSLDATVGRMRAALGGVGADCIFIDGNHSAAYVWADYAHALELLAPGGLLLFHDIYWEGDGTTLGSSTAMEWIDRVTPVYAVAGNGPVHRFFPDLLRAGPVWGCVGMIRP